MDAEQTRAAIRDYFRRTYFPEANACYSSARSPCGADRFRLPQPPGAAEAFCPPSHPAVGSSYGKKRRVVFVGLNPNLAWMTDPCTDTAARDLFTTWAEPGNPGNWADSTFRLRILKMAKAALGTESDQPDEILPYIAFTNLMKCSSTQPRGQPTYRMRIFCPPRIWPELELLRPDLIITLGSEVHETLTFSAAQRGKGVRIPGSPWSEFVAELEVVDELIPAICMYHPAGARTVNKSWSDMRNHEMPSTRLSCLLDVVFRGVDHRDWAERIIAGTSHRLEESGEEALLDFLNKLFLTPGRRCYDEHMEDRHAAMGA